MANLRIMIVRDKESTQRDIKIQKMNCQIGMRMGESNSSILTGLLSM